MAKDFDAYHEQLPAKTPEMLDAGPKSAPLDEEPIALVSLTANDEGKSPLPAVMSAEEEPRPNRAPALPPVQPVGPRTGYLEERTPVARFSTGWIALLSGLAALVFLSISIPLLAYFLWLRSGPPKVPPGTVPAGWPRRSSAGSPPESVVEIDLSIHGLQLADMDDVPPVEPEVDDSALVKPAQAAQDAEYTDDSKVFETNCGGTRTRSKDAVGGGGALGFGPGPKVAGALGIGTGLGTGKDWGSGGSGSGFGGRGSGSRKAMLASGGGTKHTERAVTAALVWLANHQNYAGNWSLDGFQARCSDKTCTGPGDAKGCDAGATAMGLLPFLAAGQTHKTKGPYQQHILKGIEWLIKNQKPDGNLAAGAQQMMYSHGLATIALCEAYGLTGDRAVGQRAQMAVDFILNAQNEADGGWRYNPKDPGDTSVVGWQLMALKSAHMAGLNVGGSVFSGTSKWLDSVAVNNGTEYAYQPGQGSAPSMTSVGLLCRQYLGAKRDNPMLTGGTAYLMKNLPEEGFPNVYYWYYATQVMHNMSGYEWDAWNRKMRDILVRTQVRDVNSCANGSWAPEKDAWAKHGGRVMSTSLSTLTLEIYYRYLPLFKADTGGGDRTFVGRPAAVENVPLEFIHLLQQEGYADVAIDYLDQLKTDPNAPKEVMDVWDLEMSRSEKEAIKQGQAYNNDQAKQWAEESKTLLEGFIKANPQRPEAIQEVARQAEEKALEGQNAVLQAGYTADKEERAKLLAKARSLFEEIRPRFVNALNSSIGVRDSLPPRAPRRKVLEARNMVAANRLAVAMVDFYLAQTQEAGPKRTADLTRCIKEFDAIYQEYRETFLGWRAHFWHARILQELGQFNDAKAVYEEVAAWDDRNIPEVGESALAIRRKAVKKTGLEDFFAEVEQYYLQTLYRLSDKKVCKEYIEEAASWRTAHKANSEKCFGYQALTLELAKNLVEIGNQSQDEAVKQKRLRQALGLLADMAKVLSPYQGDAAKLRGELKPRGSTEVTFEDAVIDGDQAMEQRKWAEAVELFEKAIAAATPTTDPARLAAVRNAVVACCHNQAVQLHQQGKKDGAVAMAKKGLRAEEFRRTRAAPGLAVFMLNVQYYQYLEAAEGSAAEKKAKGDLRAKVVGTARSILKFWAAQEEGDAARIVLMRLALDQGDMPGAEHILGDFNPASREYPKALTVLGFAHWCKYKMAKRQLEAERAGNATSGKDNHAGADNDKLAKLAEDRKLAVEYTEKAVKVLESAPYSPDSLRDCQLLLAEMYREGEDFKKSVSYYQPLIDDILKHPDKPFDETALRIFDGACQAYLQLGDIQRLAEATTKLIELGQDRGPTNLTLMHLARRLRLLREKGLAEREKPFIDLEEKVLINLSKREQISPASMIWIVNASSSLGTDAADKAAADLIAKLFDCAAHDAESARDPVIVKSQAGLQLLAADILARRGEYPQALDQIDALIRKYPKALEPRVARAKVLTAWAGRDSSKYDAAIAQWDTLRRSLELVPPDARTKVHPKYEVILNEAECCYKLARKTSDRPDANSRAKTGLDLLDPYLTMDENIRTPSKEFQDISARYFQVGGRLAEFLGMPKPVRPQPKLTR